MGIMRLGEHSWLSLCFHGSKNVPAQIHLPSKFAGYSVQVWNVKEK